MTVDTAYISTNILQRLRTNDKNNHYIQGRGGTSDVVIAFFRLGEGVATVLRLFPSNLNLKKHRNSDAYCGCTDNYIEIHPLLQSVLVRSNDIIKSASTPLLGESSQNNEKIEVTLSSYEASSSTFYHDELDSNSEKGYLEKVFIKKYIDDAYCANKADSLQVKIHLRYMCSQHYRWRFYFHDLSNNTQRIRDANNLLAQKFEHRIIAEGAILCLDMKERANRSNDSLHCSEGNKPEVVFFMVDKIECNRIQSVSSCFEENYFHKCFRLGSAESISIVLGLPDTNSATNQINNQGGTPENENLPQMQRDNVVVKSQQELGSQNYCHGYNSVLQELIHLAEFNDFNSAPAAVLLSGCSGVGKSRMSLWFGEELNKTAATPIAVLNISVKDILLEIASSTLFNSSRILEKVHNSTKSDRSLLIIDDLDVIIDSTDQDDLNASTIAGFESEQQRALQAVIKLVDSVIIESSSRCFILGISRSSWAQIPHQLSRIGRFEKVVSMSSPSLVQRRAIFKFWLSTLPFDAYDLGKKEKMINQWADLLAPRTAGCVASDIRRVCADAVTKAFARSCKTTASDESGHQVDYMLENMWNNRLAQSSSIAVIWDDVRDSARSCVPSQLSSLDVIPASFGDSVGRDNIDLGPKEVFKLAWKNFGGYHHEKQRLYRTVVRPWKHHMERVHAINQNEKYSIDSNLDIHKPSGVIFYGPSGCGKSVAALCLASSLGLHCVKVRASEVFSQWLGGSEETLRSIFARARAASPCILFFDELDSLAVNRETNEFHASSGVQSRILTTLLNEMDGITNTSGQQGILVVAATNRLEAIDAALLRPGRLEEHVELSFPDASSIEDILEIQTAKMPLDDSVDLKALGIAMEKFKTSCAEIEGLCRDASLVAMRRCSGDGTLIDVSLSLSDFDMAFLRLKGQSFLT